MTSKYTAYVSCHEGRKIDVFSVPNAGENVEKIQSVDLTGKGFPLAVTPDQRHIHASILGEKNGAEYYHIDTFEIDQPTGTLTFLSSIPVAARMSHIFVDRSGGFLLAASFPGSVIAAYPIGRRGQVQQVPTAYLPARKNAHQIATDYSNRYAFAPNLGADLVMQLHFDEKTGTFTENSVPTTILQDGAGSRHIAYHPGRKFVYLVNELDATVVGYQLDQYTGRLTEICRDSTLHPDADVVPWAAHARVSPDGRRLYTSERGGGFLVSWEIDLQTGHFANKQFAKTGGNPRAFDISPNGKIAIVGAISDDVIDIFDVSKQGKVPRKITSLPTSAEPWWVEII